MNAHKTSVISDRMVERHECRVPERGCLSRSTFDALKTRGISCAYLTIRAAAGGTPALRFSANNHE
jgi:hypothetical protein